jgi:hypothetical protein
MVNVHLDKEFFSLHEQDFWLEGYVEQLPLPGSIHRHYYYGTPDKREENIVVRAQWVNNVPTASGKRLASVRLRPTTVFSETE